MRRGGLGPEEHQHWRDGQGSAYTRQDAVAGSMENWPHAKPGKLVLFDLVSLYLIIKAVLVSNSKSYI